ncbi:MAG TPA: shikimate dehydrogenase [Pilimelia sp.]|nr:shikimate dehydrogenase [Pilimelia sp.]
MSARRAAVVGHPVRHSLSPVLHRAGYAAAGLAHWTYDAVDCPPGGLAALLARCGPEWAGLSVTMPLKTEALDCATAASAAARAVGAANTLVRRAAGWYADNTDVSGVAAVLRALGVPGGAAATVLGAGGTARAALAALGAHGVGEVAVVARRAEAVAALAPVAAAAGVRVRHVPWAQAAAALGAPLVVSTLPAGAADPLTAAARWTPGARYLDALYDPWPTPLARAAAAAGVAVASGLDLLCAQALPQFTAFTGMPAPAAAMRAALGAARPHWAPADAPAPDTAPGTARSA